VLGKLWDVDLDELLQNDWVDHDTRHVGVIVYRHVIFNESNEYPETLDP
jgi:hypothetical protein